MDPEQHIRSAHVKEHPPEHTPSASTDRERAVRKRACCVPLVIFALGVAATLLLAHRFAANADAARHERLDQWTERTDRAMRDALQRPAYLLGGARGAYAAAGMRMRAETFARYVRARDLDREAPGMLGVGLIERVPRAELPAWVAGVAAEYDGQFTLRTTGQAADLFPIRAIEPAAGNRAALGYDIGSEPLRRAAVQRVYRTGEATLTAPVRLLQAPESPGALWLTPVFASGAARADGSPVVGAVYSPILYPDLLRHVLPADETQGRFELHDLDAAAGQTQLFASPGTAGTGETRVVTFDFAGRRFAAHYEALPGLYAGLDTVPLWLVLLTGLGLSAMATMLVWVLTSSRMRALAFAESMAGDLARLAMVARLTRNAVVLTDAQGRIEWANPAFERLSGYSGEALLGATPGQLVQYDGTDPDAVRAMRDAVRRGSAFHGTIRNRAADGREYWADVEIQPVSGADGTLRGFIGVHSDVTEERRQAEALRHSEAFLERTNGAAGVGGWELDIATGRLVWSAETRRLHDLPDDVEPDVDSALQFYAPSGRPAIAAAVERALAEGTPWDLELPLVSYTGRKFWARAVGDVVLEQGRPVRLVGAFQDITARKQAEIALAGTLRLMETTLRSIGDAVITSDLEGRVVWMNPVAERLTGWSQADASGQPASAVLRLETDGRTAAPPCPIDTCLRERDTVGLAADTVLVTRDGQQRYAIEDSCAPIIDDTGVMHGAVLVFSDVSERRRLAKEMSFRARHDPLTGLANRSELESRLDDALQRVHGGGPTGALLFVDLDHFKVINDNCGHQAGDEVLLQIVDLLGAAVRQADLVARFGGDEFALVLERCPLPVAQRIAQRLCDAIDAHRYAADDGRRFRVGASIGLVPLDARWSGSAALIKAADAACYAAKAAGRGRAVLHNAAADAASGLPLPAWGARIEAALDEDSFELHAQRVVRLDGGPEGLHCEVLLRMRDEYGRLVSPAIFMPSAERYQLASRIDRWVLRNVLATLRRMSCHGIERVSINLSGQSVGDSEFHRFALRSVAESGLPPAMLLFEITETAAITNIVQAERFINDLRAQGMQVALDDFGAGAASFGYLRRLEVDKLKIDGQFVRGVLRSPLDQAAVRCFADVARVLGIRAVAEQIEDAETAAHLAEMGITYGQGYHFHRPEPFVDLLGHAALAAASDADTQRSA